MLHGSMHASDRSARRSTGAAQFIVVSHCDDTYSYHRSTLMIYIFAELLSDTEQGHCKCDTQTARQGRAP